VGCLILLLVEEALFEGAASIPLHLRKRTRHRCCVGMPGEGLCTQGGRRKYVIEDDGWEDGSRKTCPQIQKGHKQEVHGGVEAQVLRSGEKGRRGSLHSNNQRGIQTCS
jgi:hypothetical protein